MSKRDQNQIAKDQPPLDELDRLLDGALAKYASVEPRPGVNQRIIANLKAEQSKVPTRLQWPWAVFAGAVAIIIFFFALILIWKPGGPGEPNMANGISQKSQPSPQVQTQVAVSGSDRDGTRGETLQRRGVVRRPPRVLATNAPKRDQFPSPQPLSEQEKLLASYVANDPHHAVLIARARAELERRDHEEEMREMNAGSNHDSEQTQQ